jgi:hypothetical protein
LYNLWPTLKKHLGDEFPLTGPYCYGNDPKRAYTLRLSYDSGDPIRNNTWQVVKGCVQGLPCWNDEEGPVIPYNNGASGIHTVDPTGIVVLMCYLLGFLLVVSLVFNVQLSNQLKRMQDQQYHSFPPITSRYITSGGRQLYSREGYDDQGDRTDLEEPLLPATDTPSLSEEQDPTNQVQFSSSAFDALDPNPTPTETQAEDTEAGGTEETSNELD